MEANAIEIRLQNHEARLNATHDSIGVLRGVSGQHEVKIATITTELRETREDIGEMKRDFDADRKERRAEGERTRRAFYTVAAFLATFSVSIIGLIAVLLGSH